MASGRTTGLESPLRTANTTIGVSQKRPTKLMAFKTVVKWFLAVAIAFGALRAAYPAQESLGTKIKKTFEPDPTPSSSRKHRKKKTTPTPTPTASPKSKKASPTPSPTPKSKSKRKKTSPTPTPERIAVGNRDSVRESGGITRSWSREKRLA